MAKEKKYKQSEQPRSLQEPQAFYMVSPKVLQKEVHYKDFLKLSAKVPFTIGEWAGIFNVSERTMQRYAADHRDFADAKAERFHFIERVIKEGEATFGSGDFFYKWLKRKPQALGEELSVKSLATYGGMQSVYNQLLRIQHGVLS